jgi:hypothetical protein
MTNTLAKLGDHQDWLNAFFDLNFLKPCLTKDADHEANS